MKAVILAGGLGTRLSEETNMAHYENVFYTWY
jgi:NDP-sugar pyrophosphorylase family protein